MALIKEVRGKKPAIGQNVYLAETATIIGDVQIGDNSSIWFGVVIRGDVNSIKIGNNTNIQDNTVIHATYEKYPAVIGNNVSVGHSAIIHACTIKDNVLVGMGAIIMDNATVEEGAIIAAGAVVTPGTVVEKNSLYAGVPAKKIKNLDEKTIEASVKATAQRYQMYTQWYNTKKD